MKPLFSVLVANYNNGTYLQEAIDSVLAQTYDNWEVVLVDDKSTDESLAIYGKYATDKRFKIYHNDANRGCGYTKRRCAELAAGELCGFLDPDDALMPEALETAIPAGARRGWKPGISSVRFRKGTISSCGARRWCPISSRSSGQPT